MRYYFSLLNDQYFDTGYFIPDGNSKKAAEKHARKIMEKHNIHIANLEVNSMKTSKVLDIITIEL